MESSGEQSWRLLTEEYQQFCLHTPRVCDDYWSEFQHCKSFWNRFHHYYTYGTSPSCQQWKEDYYNCKEWENTRSVKAKESLLMSERDRLTEQKKFTPVWKLRKGPPRDWHLPLKNQ